jgi:hypothetical protein
MISPLTERVPGIERLGHGADGVNNEWIYASDPPICRRGVNWDTFTVYIYCCLLQTYEKTINGFLGGKRYFILRTVRDMSIDLLNVRAGGACK